MSFLQLPSELHTSLLLEWIPFYKEYSALDVAISDPRYWLELLSSPALQVDPPMSMRITPARSYYAWLESRKLKISTLHVNMAEISSIKAMRFPSVQKVVAIFKYHDEDKISILADFLKANGNISHLSTQSTPFRLDQELLMALVKHSLDLRVLDLLGTAIDTDDTFLAGGVFALLYSFGSKLEELRLKFCDRDRNSFTYAIAEILQAIGQRCLHLRKLQLVGTAIHLKPILRFCERNGSITELFLNTHFDTAEEGAKACQSVLERLPKLEHLALLAMLSSSPYNRARFPPFAHCSHLQSIATDEGSVDFVNGTIEITNWVGNQNDRTYDILMTLPAMKSISCARTFSSSEVLQIVQKHGSQLERIAFAFAPLTANEWQQLWTMCPNLKAITNSQFSFNLFARSFNLLRNNKITAIDAADILLNAPVQLLTIQFDNNTLTLLPPADILAVAEKHGNTLKKFGIRLDVVAFGIPALTKFFTLCPELQYIDLMHADADSLHALAVNCKRMVKLRISGGHAQHAQAMDAAIITILQEHPQLHGLTLIDSSMTAAVLDYVGSLTNLSMTGNSAITTNDIVEALTTCKFKSLIKLCLGGNRAQLVIAQTMLQLTNKTNPTIVTYSFQDDQDFYSEA